MMSVFLNVSFYVAAFWHLYFAQCDFYVLLSYFCVLSKIILDDVGVCTGAPWPNGGTCSHAVPRASGNRMRESSQASVSFLERSFVLPQFGEAN